MVRRATAQDAEPIAELFRRSYGTLEFLPTLHTPEEDRAYLTKAVAEQDVWVAEEDGRVAGFIALEGNLGTFFYVDPAFHDRGIGSALFDTVREARPGGFEFWVFQANERARRFYEKRGCVAVKFTEGEDNEEKIPDALYRWTPGG